jgi:hypothetical protein
MWISFKISEAEHGYASTLPMPDDYSAKKRSKSKKSQGNRYKGSHGCSFCGYIFLHESLLNTQTSDVFE